MLPQHTSSAARTRVEESIQEAMTHPERGEAPVVTAQKARLVAVAEQDGADDAPTHK